MNRRDFLSSRSAVAPLTALPSAAAPPPEPVLMRLGCQSAPTNEQHLQYLERYGVQGICGYPEIADGRLYATPRRTEANAGPRRAASPHGRLSCAAFSRVEPYRSREAPRHH